MVIEQFRSGDTAAAYRRFREQGRGAPEGLTYVGSWIDVGLSRCFQLMEADDAALLQEWCAFWADLVEFEVVPVTTSAETAALMTRRESAT